MSDLVQNDVLNELNALWLGGFKRHEAIEALVNRFGPLNGHEEWVKTEVDRRYLGEFHLTDQGNAQRLVLLAGRDLRYCADRSQWIVWDGKRWKWDTSSVLVENRATDIVKALCLEASKAEDSEERKKVMQWALASESAHRLLAMVRLAQSKPDLQLSLSELDTSPYLFNVDNGTIDLRTGVLQKHNRADFITKLAPVAYDPHGPTETWRTFIADITCGDNDLQIYLQKAIGYAMAGHNREDLVFFLHGVGSNGKSTFMGAIQAMMGKDQYAGTVSASALIGDSKRNAGHRDELASVVGARLVVVAECPDRMKLDMATIKAFTGGDTVKVSRKYEKSYDADPVFTPFLYGNSKPRVDDPTEGTWRRLRLIPFDAHFDGNRVDTTLREKLKNDCRAQVLTWAVAGAVAYHQEGLKDPDTVVAATSEYRREEDNFGRFLSDCCEEKPFVTSLKKDLYDAYFAWCEATAEVPMGRKKFGSRAKERFLESQSGSKHYWMGVRLIPENLEDAPVAPHALRSAEKSPYREKQKDFYETGGAFGATSADSAGDDPIPAFLNEETIDEEDV